MGLFYAFLHPQKHIHLHISKNIARNPAELWDIKNRRVPNTRLLLSLVGATISRFCKQSTAKSSRMPRRVGAFRTKPRERFEPDKRILSFESARPKQKKTAKQAVLNFWSGRKDSNLRHLGPKPSTLPD